VPYPPSPRPADKLPLSRERRTYRETPDVAKATGRLILSLGKRVGTEDPPDLQILLELEAKLARAWESAIAGLRHTGYSDGQIGDELGTTKQAVQQRWPR
jgi:hypothetical protein